MLQITKDQKAADISKDGDGSAIISSKVSDIEVIAINDSGGRDEGRSQPCSISLRIAGQNEPLCVRGATREDTIDLLLFLREHTSKPIMLNLNSCHSTARGELVGASARTMPPRFSLQRLELYVEWINSLRVWESRIDVSSLTQEMASGLLLCAIMEHLVPGTSYQGLHKRPLSRLAAVHNIEQGLAVVWRAAQVNNSLIPAAMEIYQGNAMRVNALIAEIFEVYVLRPIRNKFAVMTRWYNSVLKHYGRALPSGCDLRGLWSHFQDGVSLFCVMYHFHGSSLIGAGNHARYVNPTKVYAKPVGLAQHRSNVQECFYLLQAVGIDVVWGVDIWLSYPDADFVLYQLFKIYEAFVEKVCVLPPAHRDKAGLVSGPNGLRVKGLVFADEGLEVTGPEKSSLPYPVYLGDGTKQSLAILPVCDEPMSVPRLGMGMTLESTADLTMSQGRTGGLIVDSFLRRQFNEQREYGWNASIAETTAYRSEHHHNLLYLQVRVA